MPCSTSRAISINFLLGEKRPLKFEATYDNYPDFVIDSASYQIFSKGTMVSQGSMSIDVHDVTLTYEATERGYFDLYIELEIGGAIRKKHFIINVD